MTQLNSYQLANRSN